MCFILIFRPTSFGCDARYETYSVPFSALIPTLLPPKGDTSCFERRHVPLRVERVMLRFGRTSILSFFAREKGKCSNILLAPRSLMRYEIERNTFKAKQNVFPLAGGGAGGEGSQPAQAGFAIPDRDFSPVSHHSFCHHSFTYHATVQLIPSIRQQTRQSR